MLNPRMVGLLRETLIKHHHPAFRLQQSIDFSSINARLNFECLNVFGLSEKAQSHTHLECPVRVVTGAKSGTFHSFVVLSDEVVAR